MADLRRLRRWCVWNERPNPKGGKARKEPFNSSLERKASSTDPQTWVSYDEAHAAFGSCGYDGVMFALCAEDGLVFVDLDGCRDPETGTIEDWAQEIVKRLNSYTEVSPSGTGLHVLVRGVKPPKGCRRGNVEMYSTDRFICMTFQRLRNLPTRFAERQDEIEWLHREYVSGPKREIVPPAISQIAPETALQKEKLNALLQNAKAKAIYSGESNGTYPSQSEADLALAGFAVGAGFSEGEVAALIGVARANAKADSKHPGYYALTFAKARGDFKPTDLDAARSVFKRHLYLPDTVVLDVTLGVAASAHLPGEALWLHLVGPPSTAKTEHINAIATWPTVYALSEVTPAGLVSGKNSDDGKDHSLLPLVNNKTLAIKDFTPLLGLPKEQRERLLGRLRDAFDGEQAVHTAMVGTRRHKATFNCLTGVTPAIEKLSRQTSLGERYLLFRHVAADPLLSAERALEGAPVKGKIRAELRAAACGVLAGVDYDCIPYCSSALKAKLVRLAAMLAKARTFVERSRDHAVEIVPESEGPARIVQQLFKLGQGMALINRRRELNDADMNILRRIALDSILSKRRKFLDLLIGAQAGIKTEAFIEGTGLGQSAVHEALEDLCLLKIAKKETVQVTVRIGGTEGQTETNEYRLTDEFRELVEGSGIGSARSQVRNAK
jgi:hypothetical protein